MKKPTLDLVLGKNRPLKNNTYPLSLRVTYERVPRLIGLGISMKKDDFTKIWKAKSPRDFNLTQKKKLDKDFIQKSNNILDQMEKDGIETFDFHEFRDRFSGKKLEKNSNLLTMYERIINEFNSKGRIGTADTYRNSRKLLLKYFKTKNGEIRYNSIKLNDLIAFEKYVINECKLSETTLSIYFRCLRAVYNKAIEDNIITKEINPFNPGNKEYYVIPQGSNVKKALEPADIIKLIKYNDYEGSPRIKAKDFWLLSFFCYGMNICDLLLLKNENINNDVLYFTRQKTRRTKRKKLPLPVIISLNEKALEIINRYRNSDSDPDSYLFRILSPKDTDLIQRNKIKNFTRFINQHVKNIAKTVGITTDVSTYFARHSFATIARNRKTTVEEISVMLAHSDISTTQNYLASFGPDMARSLTDNIYKDF